MTATIEQTIEIDAPVEKVFAYVEDFTRIGEWLYGLHEIKPVDGPLHGLGATYEGTVRLGVPLRSRVTCTDYELNRLVEITSVKGVKNTQRWTFTDLGQGRTKVDVWISYDLPGGPAGGAIERAVKPLVGIAVRHSSESLVRNAEAL